MKNLLALIIVFGLITTVHAQTSKELIGKWKLVKWTLNGNEKDISSTFKTDQVYQVFKDDNSFISLVGDKETDGKWELKDNNSTLIIGSGMSKTKFHVDSFDSKKRVITSEKLGTLEYQKVE